VECKAIVKDTIKSVICRSTQLFPLAFIMCQTYWGAHANADGRAAPPPPTPK